MGAPDDAEGKCNAHLYIGDDYPMCACKLHVGHYGRHEVMFHRGGLTVDITWWIDEHRVAPIDLGEPSEVIRACSMCKGKGLYPFCQGCGASQRADGRDPGDVS